MLTREATNDIGRDRNVGHLVVVCVCAEVCVCERERERERETRTRVVSSLDRRQAYTGISLQNKQQTRSKYFDMTRKE